MTDRLNIANVKKLIFMTEESYLMHLGEYSEDKILQANKDKEAVIRINNINGTTTCISLERALHLLEKYYKLSGKEKKKASIISIKSAANLSLDNTDDTIIEEKKQMA